MMGTSGAFSSNAMRSYETVSDLPMTGVKPGTLAHVESNGNGDAAIYVWRTTTTAYGWDLVVTVNQSPVVSDGAGAYYVLDLSDPPLVLSFAASDPEGLPLQWSYEIIGGDQMDAVIDQTGGSMTITPGLSRTSMRIRVTITDGASVSAFDFAVSVTSGYEVARNDAFVLAASHDGQYLDEPIGQISAGVMSGSYLYLAGVDVVAGTAHGSLKLIAFTPGAQTSQPLTFDLGAGFIPTEIAESSDGIVVVSSESSGEIKVVLPDTSGGTQVSSTYQAAAGSVLIGAQYPWILYADVGANEVVVLDMSNPFSVTLSSITSLSGAAGVFSSVSLPMLPAGYAAYSWSVLYEPDGQPGTTVAVLLDVNPSTGQLGLSVRSDAYPLVGDRHAHTETAVIYSSAYDLVSIPTAGFSTSQESAIASPMLTYGIPDPISQVAPSIDGSRVYATGGGILFSASADLSVSPGAPADFVGQPDGVFGVIRHGVVGQAGTTMHMMI